MKFKNLTIEMYTATTNEFVCIKTQEDNFVVVLSNCDWYHVGDVLEKEYEDHMVKLEHDQKVLLINGHMSSNNWKDMEDLT